MVDIVGKDGVFSTQLSSPGGFAMLVDPGFMLPPHLQLLNSLLVNLATGRIRRLVVQMPPRHGKSQLCSKYFPPWFLGLWPNKRIILSSYESSFAASWGRKARDVYGEFAPSLFGTGLRKDVRTQTEWGIAGHDGSMTTSGVGGPITGKGADVFIIDDPVKNSEEAMSPTYRDKAWNWYLSTARTRLEPGASIMVVMTRWHHDDLAGRLLGQSEKTVGTDFEAQDENEKWHSISLPAFAEENDPLGRKPGAALWPERYDERALEAIRSTSEPMWWSSLFQQNPTPEKGGIVKREWFRYYTHHGLQYKVGDNLIDRTEFLRFLTVDLAASLKERADFTVISSWGYCPKTDQLVLFDLQRERMEAPRIVPAIKVMAKKWGAAAVWIEKAGFQLALVQQAREEGLPVRELEADKDKVSRMYSAAPMFEAGKVFFPENPAWLPAYEMELLHFPAASHDDQADVTAYAIAYCLPPRHGAGVRAPVINGRSLFFPRGWSLAAPTELVS